RMEGALREDSGRLGASVALTTAADARKGDIDLRLASRGGYDQLTVARTFRVDGDTALTGGQTSLQVRADGPPGTLDLVAAHADASRGQGEDAERRSRTGASVAWRYGPRSTSVLLAAGLERRRRDGHGEGASVLLPVPAPFDPDQPPDSPGTDAATLGSATAGLTLAARDLTRLEVSLTLAGQVGSWVTALPRIHLAHALPGAHRVMLEASRDLGVPLPTPVGLPGLGRPGSPVPAGSPTAPPRTDHLALAWSRRPARGWTAGLQVGHDRTRWPSTTSGRDRTSLEAELGVQGDAGTLRARYRAVHTVLLGEASTIFLPDLGWVPRFLEPAHAAEIEGVARSWSGLVLRAAGGLATSVGVAGQRVSTLVPTS
ncbi:MAG: hypothetical protein KC656_16520, partial [Myxococcales bacterium]|nr:hypothetical protein [Myxococcales bacterium]